MFVSVRPLLYLWPLSLVDRWVVGFVVRPLIFMTGVRIL